MSNTVLAPITLLSGSTIYASQGSVYALDKASGAFLQHYPIAGLPSTTAASDGLSLYLNVSNHPQDSIQALSVHDGSLLWNYEVDGRLVGDPVIADGVVYASIAEGTMYALQASSGTLLWSTSMEPGAIVLTAPTVANGVVYLAPVVHRPLQPRLYAFHARNGNKLWATDITGGAAFPLTVVREVIFMSRHRGCSALSARDGSTLWHYETSSHTCSSPVVFRETVYLSYLERKYDEALPPSHGQEASLCALDASTGSLLWELPFGRTAGAGYFTTPLITDDTIYMGRDDGSFCAYRIAGRTLRWRYQTSGSLLSAPIEADGVVYVGANDGCVYALRASDGVLLWQTFVSVAASVSTFSEMLTIEPWKS